MLRVICFFLLLPPAAWAATCAVPEVNVAVAPRGGSFDPVGSRRFGDLLIMTAQHDAERARGDRSQLGSELANTSRDELYSVSYDLFTLAVRLRQLDCAVARGQPPGDSDALYAAIADEARAFVAPLPPAPPLKPPPPPAPPNPRRLARGYGLGGAFALAAGAGILAGAVKLSLQVASWKPPQDCQPDNMSIFCELGNSLDRDTHKLEIAADVMLWIGGIGSAVAGATLAAKGFQWDDRVRPSLSLSPTGGSLGVQVRF
jgi:hypothetical protein